MAMIWLNPCQVLEANAELGSLDAAEEAGGGRASEQDLFAMEVENVDWPYEKRMLEVLQVSQVSRCEVSTSHPIPPHPTPPQMHPNGFSSMHN